MGFDITLHPLSLQEFRQFLAMAVDKDNLMAAYQDYTRNSAKLHRYQFSVRFIASDVTAHEKKSEHLRQVYYRFPQWQKDVLSKNIAFEKTFGYAAAVIAGYLHPYWYLRGTGLSWLCMKDSFFFSFLESITALVPEYFGNMKDTSGGMITENYQGGGYVAYEKLEALTQALIGPYRELADEVLGDQGLETLLTVIRYAQEHETGILEAADVMVPFSGECATDHDHLRAGYLKNINDLRNQRERYCRSLEEAFQHHKNVTMLNLGYVLGNDRPEPLPDETGTLTQLRELIIHPGFQITSLPTSIGSLQRLERIYIIASPGGSQSLHTLPPEIGQLASLYELTLTNYHLKSLPAEIGQLPKLRKLNLSGNDLAMLPASISELSKIIVLDLPDNRLNTLPESISQLTQLAYLNLENNQLTTLPESLASLPKLREVKLKGNQFTRSEKIRLNKIFAKKLRFT